MKDNNKDKNLIAYYFSGKLWPGTKYPEGHFNHFPSYNWGQSWSSYQQAKIQVCYDWNQIILGTVQPLSILN